MQKEKIRVYVLARELDVETKDLLDLCKQAGFDVKNQLSNLEPEQRTMLEQMLQKAKTGHKPGAGGAAKPVMPTVMPESKPIRDLTSRIKPREERHVQAPVEEPAVAVEEAPALVIEEAPAPAPAAAEAPKPVAPKPPVLPTLKERVPTLTGRTPTVTPPPVKPTAPATTLAPPPPPPAPAMPVTPAAKGPEVRPQPKPEARPALTPTPATGAPRVPPSLPSGTRVPPSLPSARPGTTGGPGRPIMPGQARPAAGPGTAPRTPGQHTAGRLPPTKRPGDVRPGLAPLKPLPPPALKPLQPKPAGEKVLKPIATFTKDQLTQKAPVRPDEMINPKLPVTVKPGEAGETDEDDKEKKLKEVPGRDRRRAERNERAEKRKAKDQVKIVGGKLVDLEDEAAASKRLLHRLKKGAKPTAKPQGPIILESPVSIRAISEALGIKSGELLFKLMGHGAGGNLTINSTVDASLVELLGIDYGREIHVKMPMDDQDKLLASFDKPDTEENLVSRAPIVTIMGHVDHGKTTLLDKIRKTDVAATEAGGITQVIRAWRVEHGGRPITFLDTPGHEAFTKMRARGANVTDIAVIVVAADDGVMPQTEEAINHAKAAGVSLVVAINKVDLPSANVNKTRQQLYGLNVLPDDMGGDAPFVETSAASGKGIDDLLDQISLVAELKELKANPAKPGKGTCLEAMLSEGEGVRATLLIREGTLRKGDVILCGHSYGRVRQMYNDLGQPIEEAGPSVPVRITGLDEVPNADDVFQVLPDLAMAREAASNRKSQFVESSQTKRAPLSLESLAQIKPTEVKIILKADFRGSIEAIKKEMEKFQHQEVRIKLLEASIGAITENDVWLALTSPEDTLIVGFNAVPDDRARSLAEEKGVQIREYNIIYNLTNDIRAALEGKLKPREEVIHLGRAVVRETFKISKTGTIAGCYVTQGVIRRNAKIRLIREGVVIFPPADRSAGLDSLKRFKEDVSEVREGFECGIKIAGYDDIKVGDVIEGYRIDQVQRTLE